VHRRLALEIADLSAALSSAADVPSDLRRRVYVLAIWLLQLESDLDAILELEKVLMRAQEHFPQDPLVLLAGGTYHEHRARPHVLRLASDGRGGDAEAWRREERAWRIQKAEAQYREVLRIDAGQAEAHLRLARVLLLQRRADEARAALDRAHEAATEARLRYLVAMFRAAAVESDGEAGDARAHYAEALRIWPEAQSPRLGLSRLHASAGDWSAALEWLRGLETPPSRGPQFDDPWWAYDFGQVWRFESGVLELRKVLHP
jgi:tetratricopeptide (TPR) repeat protein